MDDAVARKRLGGLMLAAGIVGLIRMIPELAGIGYGEPPVYWVVVSIDVFLAIWTVATGLAWNQRHDWAAGAAAWAAGALLVTSVIWGVLLAPDVVWSLSHRSKGVAILIPRLLYYLGVVAFWPDAVWAIWTILPLDRRKPMLFQLGFSVLIRRLVTGLLALSSR